MTLASAWRPRSLLPGRRWLRWERAKQPGYYSRAHTDIINAHADLRAALDMLVKVAGPEGHGITRNAGSRGFSGRPEPWMTNLPDWLATGLR